MKALTLTQPWATLVAIGAKSIETRSWRVERTPVRIAIHAAKGFPDDARYIATTEPFHTALGGGLASELPIGKIIAIADLTICFRFAAGTERQIRERSADGALPPHEADFGDFSAGRYGFRLLNVVKLPEPVEARGMLNLWNVPEEIAAIVEEQVAGAQGLAEVRA